ncbi:MAG: ATP-grasp fold amidoligase family protein [Knoellia sp.]
MGPVPLPLPLKRFLRDPLWTVDPRRTAYRRLIRSVPANPDNFTEKVLHKMAFDRSPILKTFADKVAVRDFVTERVGSDVLPELYGIHSDLSELDWSSLPRQFVLKASHGSGGVAVVWEGAARGTRPTADQVPSWSWRDEIHPDDLDREQLVRLAQGWLGLTYELTDRLPEWAYANLPPRVIAEEVLINTDGELPADYKLYMMHGRCSAIAMHTARFTDHRTEFHSPEWEVMSGGQIGLPAPDALSPPPPNLARMLEVSEALSRDVDFVRVDLYELGDRIAFGELTNYPDAASRKFDPPEFNQILCADWHPPKSYG